MPKASKLVFSLAAGVIAVSTLFGCSAVQQPDIRVENVQSTVGVNFSLGYYATVSYTLHNYGDVAGQAKITYSGTASGFISSETVIVPAQQTIVKNQRVDISSQDFDVFVNITEQTKLD